MADRRAKCVVTACVGYFLCRILLSSKISLGSFSALCKISDVKIFQKAAAPTVFIQFQPNVTRNLLLIGEYRLLFFAMGQKKYGALNF